VLHEFITTNRAGIIARCQQKAHARLVAAHSNVELENAAPRFLDELVTELRRDTPMRTIAIRESAVQHGHDLLAKGFTVSQVVHEYGDICQAVTELVIERHAQISPDDFRRLNRCLDDAIAGAVTEYGRSRDDTINQRAHDEDQRLLSMTTKLQTAVHMARMACDVIKTGDVGVSGSTSRLLDISLTSANGLVEDLLGELASKSPATIPA